jgi:hypothetical protein
MLNLLPSGFSMMFGNGITVAVVFPNFGSNNNTAVNEAEIVVYNEDGDYIYEIVKWENSEQFAEILAKVAAIPDKN